MNRRFKIPTALRGTPAFAALLAFVLAGAAAAQQVEVDRTPGRTDGEVVFLPLASPALQAAVDEEGELRAPTPEEARALSERSRSLLARMLEADGPRQPLFAGAQADGTGYQQLDASLMDFFVARRAADGTLTVDCVTGAQQARAVVEEPASSRNTSPTSAAPAAREQE